MTDRPGRPQLEYRRVADELAARIADGARPPGSRLAPETAIEPGSKLPAEPALALEYEVAYGTIRRAMDVLRERELVVTIWGKGTFVRGERDDRSSGSAAR